MSAILMSPDQRSFDAHVLNLNRGFASFLSQLSTFVCCCCTNVMTRFKINSLAHSFTPILISIWHQMTTLRSNPFFRLILLFVLCIKSISSNYGKQYWIYMVHSPTTDKLLIKLCLHHSLFMLRWISLVFCIFLFYPVILVI